MILRTASHHRGLVLLIASALLGAVAPPAAADARWVAQSLPAPISFQRNDGQFAPEVLFASSYQSGLLTVRAGEIAIAPRAASPESPLSLRMVGANPAPELEATTLLATRSHYYTGGQPIENVPHYAELRLKDVYPGIDVALHGGDGAVEYDFVLAPRADPRDIRIDLRGMDRVSLDNRGNLVIEHAGQVLEQRAPVAFQGEGGKRRNVDAHFEIVETDEGLQARIALAPYDASKPLVVDPVLVYSTYVGGIGPPVMPVRTDSAGRVYYVNSDPTTSNTLIVSCLDTVTNTIVYQTHFGGDASVGVSDLAVAADGTAYVIGTTFASNFPAAHSANGWGDAYVARFKPQGQLDGGVVIGGSFNDSGESIALDASGNIYAAGNTGSSDFPTTTGPASNGGTGGNIVLDGFVAKYDPNFTPVYARFVGGTNTDQIIRMAVDAAGQAIVVGYSASTSGFPIVNPGAPTSPGPGGFISKLTADGTGYVYSQYISSTMLTAVAIDPTTGDAVAAGYIGNSAFALASPLPYMGSDDALVVRVSPAGVPVSGTLLGGVGMDHATAVTANAVGDVFVAGITHSADFPTVGPLAGTGPHNSATSADGFVARLRDNAVDFSTYLGGNAGDTPQGLAVDADGSLYVSGTTQSADFPLLDPLHAPKVPSGDGFVSRIAGFTAPSTASSSFLNMSTRGFVSTGDNVIIGGFIIGGTQAKTVVIRGRGPSLAQFGIPNTLQDPVLQVVRSSDQSTVASNDDWQSAPSAPGVSASGFGPQDPRESAVLLQLPPGAYTAILSGAGGQSGVGIVEFFEVDEPRAPFIDVATRGFVGTGSDVMIAGFIVRGPNAHTVIVRARGPSLTQAGVPGALSNPQLQLVRSSDQAALATNDDWQSAANAAQIVATGFAPLDGRESAVMMTLQPGAYTAIVSGVGGASGVGIVEVFQMP